MPNHTIGLLLGAENDWPTAFEALVRRAKLDFTEGGERRTYDVERVGIEPFDLRARPTYDVVIDRLAYWYYHPREWLKKAAMMDRTYLLNNPFTFQSMEKHTAFCGMIRLGLHIPETWLLPPKEAPRNERFEVTAQRYVRLFELDRIAERIGYPLYLKPFDGGGWVGVTKVTNADELNAAYDDSGDRLMHLQKGLVDYEVFCRNLSIGPQSCVMRYEPGNAMHERYQIDHQFLDSDLGKEVETIGLLVNAFFRWEFNSCETIIKDGVVYPIDFANACPDVALVSLHYYFPWAMKALVRWSLFVASTERIMRIDMNKRKYYAVGDCDDLNYQEKLQEYRGIVDDYFEKDRFDEFCARHLTHFDEVALEYFKSAEFDDLLVESVKLTFPDYEHDQFIAHFRGIMGHWADAEETRLAGGDASTAVGGNVGVRSDVTPPPS